MKLLSQVLAPLLAIVILFSVYSCSDASVRDNTETTTGGDTISDIQSENETETVDDRYSANLPIKDMGGYVLRIYGKAPNGGHDWHVHDMIAEEMTGEVFNDAVYGRNLFLEETYNFTFELTESSLEDPYDEIYKMSTAGDTSYDDYCVSAYTAVKLAKEGLLYNLITQPYFDFTQSYWSPSLLAPMTVNNKLYMATGDITVVPKEGVRAFYFNKTLAEELQLEDIYSLARDGKWTHDKMFSMMESATHDIDGDGDIDKFDRWGFQGQSLMGMVLYQGSGESIISKDSNDKFIITAGTERSINALMKVTELLNTNSSNVYISDDWQNMLKMFNNDQALFYTEVMLHIETMRGYDVDFGIIPTPKYDESQKDYSHYIDAGCNYFHTIPSVGDTPDVTAYILEATAVASRHYITPAYYDICLKSKYARDEQSSEMLDIIFSTYHLELGDVYSFGNLHGFLTTCMTDNGNIVSTITALQKLTEKAINKTMDKYDSLD